ncbi:RNA-guided endonuclease InsQ/TnpB family protein [Microseira sp. BLCC-F43]|uniref:RNA-guided endonuclease InsQ/TnpB family protein n=1 Tax=Microseira sp. BLCC-F43 TaxID=3153602 RepID=UPI0035B9464B
MGNRSLGVKASNNALKYYQRLAKRPARIAKIRRDFLPKNTTDISLKYYRIRIEDLNVAGRIANQKLADAISSLGFYEFRRMLIYKVTFFGTTVELVERWFPSSKTCSCCGNIQPMPLKERVYFCSKCGVSIDRDLNAAINLENAPKTLVRAASAEFTPGDC